MAQTMASSSSCFFTATTTHKTTFPSLFKPSSLSLSTSFTPPFVSGSISSDFSGNKLRPLPLTASPTSTRPKRSVVAMVIPFVRGPGKKRPPPDLATFLFKERIVYLGMSFSSRLIQLILAEFLYLQNVDEEKPIYLYINSTGTMSDNMVGYETETFALYDVMRFVKPSIYTLCIGNAWGEAALLLAAGAKGNRAAMPSTTIMIRQPLSVVKGQATDIDSVNKDVTSIKADMVKFLARHIGKTTEEIEADIRRPKYFSPSQAVEYGIIDKVLYNERSRRDRGFGTHQKSTPVI